MKEGREKGLRVMPLKGRRANRREVEGHISQGAGLFILNGHGNEGAIFGQDNEPVADERNIEKFSGVVYTIACNAAKSLGRIAVRKNTKCFIGYAEEFAVVYDHSKTATPLKDGLALPFFDSTNRVPIAIMKGNTCGDSVERARRAYGEWIIKLRNLVMKERLPEQEWVLRALIWDSFTLQLHGDEKARL